MLKRFFAFFAREQTLQEWVKENRYQLQKWSRAVKKRGNNTCVACGEVEGNTPFHAHHVVPKSVDRSIALKISNGEVLCPKCHINGTYAWHKIHSDKVGDRKIFNEWVAMVRARKDGRYGIGAYLLGLLPKIERLVVFFIGVGLGLLLIL